MTDKKIEKNQEKHTSNIQIQIDNIEKRIKNLTLHLSKNKKDFSSKRAIYKLSKKNKKMKSYLRHQIWKKTK